ncbi:hypothetical protein [Saccharicrinis aurantiacus]|uniref:hypothetical protein n=1 Tax=Saccharicrinis aurantiacus TaxID=1849719 RepID=UPI00248F66C6|nr:hypothetical protein [Saccharicrinis aurantiacus]
MMRKVKTIGIAIICLLGISIFLINKPDTRLSNKEKVNDKIQDISPQTNKITKSNSFYDFLLENDTLMISAVLFEFNHNEKKISLLIRADKIIHLFESHRNNYNLWDYHDTGQKADSLLRYINYNYEKFTPKSHRRKLFGKNVDGIKMIYKNNIGEINELNITSDSKDPNNQRITEFVKSIFSEIRGYNVSSITL